MTQTTEAKRVLRALATLRPRIDQHEAKREELYAKQRTLYEQGARLSPPLTAADMARAMRPDGEHEHLAESIRQHLRTLGLPKKKARRAPAKKK